MKKCSGACGLELDESMFYKGRAACKKCVNKTRNDRRNGIFSPIIKPEIRECRIEGCGAKSDKVEFKEGTNICMPHHAEYMQEYRKEHREELNKQIQEWKNENRDHVRQKNRENYATDNGKTKHKTRVEKTHRTWLSHLLSALKGHASKPGLHDPKGNDPRREFDIDLGYVCDMWDNQKGLCSITKLPMLHRFNNLRSVSIDRIDQKKGHIKGNIQLVCQFANTGRRDHDLLAFKQVIRDIVIANQGMINENFA